MTDLNPDGCVAIIGMSCRFAGAKTPEELWRNLRSGTVSIKRFSQPELEEKGVTPSMISDANFVRAAGSIDGIDLFDAGYFGITPAEAETIDPQHRVFLECALEALEDGGCDPDTYDGAIGVFGGSSMNSYVAHILASSESGKRNLAVGTGNDKDYLATRVSHKLNLRGPSVAVQSACSTSLLALHLACQALLSGECDLALAGGVSIATHGHIDGKYSAGYVAIPGMLSTDGMCRPFDSVATGTIFSDGAGVLLLKPLAAALAERDCIRAIIRGSSSNNDGGRKVGFTAPSVDGQAAVIAEALAVAGLAPDAVDFVETHGTGTPLGDPIEFAALNQIYGRRATGNICTLGSMKANVGHSKHAAGVAGVIKTVLALEKEEVPPQANYISPNPEIDLTDCPFGINTEVQPWPRSGMPRRAGVSSFGFGGTNVHVILEEAPKRSSHSATRPVVVPLSAKSLKSLKLKAIELADFLREEGKALDLNDIAFTLAEGRQAHKHRAAVVGASGSEVAVALDRKNNTIDSGGAANPTGGVAFLFPGQGTQYVNMGRVLYDDATSVFRMEFDRCATMISNHSNRDISRILYPRSESDDAPGDIHNTENAQPLIFAVSYALAKHWMSLGVTPQALLGHSLGELVAACVSGVFSLDDALAAVCLRATLMQNCRTGAMLAVQLSELDSRAFLTEDVELAAVNGSTTCTLAGPHAAIEQLEALLGARNIAYSRLKTSHAYHTKSMQDAKAPLVELISRLRLNSPAIPFISNVSGSWISPGDAVDPHYWGRHLLGAVRFADGLSQLLSTNPSALLEVGPGRTLIGLARQTERSKGLVCAYSLPLPNEVKKSAADQILSAAASLWEAHVSLDWSAVNANDKAQKVSLPTYPFQRQSFWPMSNGRQPAEEKVSAGIDEAFRAVSWKREAPGAPSHGADDIDNWLVFEKHEPLVSMPMFDGALRRENVIKVREGTAYREISAGCFEIDSTKEDHFHQLMNALDKRGRFPDRILYQWSALETEDDSAGAYEQAVRYCYNAALFLVRSLWKQNPDAPVELVFLTSGIWNVMGGDLLSPLGSIAIGPTLSIPVEHPNIVTRCVDVPNLDPDRWASELAINLRSAIEERSPHRIIALRGEHRWSMQSESVQLPKQKSPESMIRSRGACLITGGLGDLGLAVARHFAATAQTNLILLGRTEIPEKQLWDGIVHRDDADPRIRRILKGLKEIENAGGQVLVCRGDVAKMDDVARARDTGLRHFGRIDGIVHAAGMPGDGLIQIRDLQSARKVLDAKIAGLRNLEQAFGKEFLDYLVLFSSTAALAGGIAQADYCAANAYLDAYAQRGKHDWVDRVISINWGMWRDIGMGVNTFVPPGKLRDLRERNLLSALTTEEGIDAMMRALASKHRQVSVSKRSSNAVRLSGTQASSEDLDRNASKGSIKVSSSMHLRPEMSTPYVEPSSDLERSIAEIWRDLFHIDQIGVEDDFFELGGHSLLGIQLLAKLKQRFNLDMAPKELFKCASISATIKAMGSSDAGLAPLQPEQPMAMKIEA